MDNGNHRIWIWTQKEPKKKKKLITERYATGEEDTYSLLYMDTVLLSVVRVCILFIHKARTFAFPIYARTSPCDSFATARKVQRAYN